MTLNSMDQVDSLAVAVEEWLGEVGEVFRAWRFQDSGCVALGAEVDGRRWFVKHAVTDEAATSLASAIRFHGAVRHPVIVPLVSTMWSPSGPVLVYPWRDGEILYDPVQAPGSAGREAPGAPHARFRSMGSDGLRHAIDCILDAHRTVVAAGYVAVDLYDGCILYDFARGEVHLCDLDEYRPGPFRVGGSRLPGSIRFMAPEETQPGALIDERTTVFNLGRMIEELGGGRLSSAVAGVVERATLSDRADRCPSVEALVAAWRTAVDL